MHRALQRFRGNPTLPAWVRALLNFFPIYGQSLAVGQTPTLISSTPSGQHKMFVGGVRSQYTAGPPVAGIAYNSLVALREQADAAAPWDIYLRETPCAGAAEMISQLIAAENGIPAVPNTTMLMSSPGYGAQSIYALSPYTGSGHYERMLQQAEFGRALAMAGGYTYKTPAMGWVQGESDYLAGTDQATYTTRLQALAGYFATQAKGASNQDQLALTLVGQIASHLYVPTPTPSIALAQIDAVNASPLIRMACAMSQFDYNNDFHLLAPDSKWLGAYLGLAWKRIIYDGILDWSGGLNIISAVRNGDGIDVVTDAIGQLTIDTTWVAPLADGNYGIQVVTSADAPVTVTGVTVVGIKGLHIACAAGGGAGSKIRTSWAGTVGQTGPGRLTGARTNIRDNYGDTLTFEVDVGDFRPMHRWLLIQEVVT